MIKHIAKSKISPLSALVITITTFLSQACSPFSEPVNKAVSNNYFYGKSKKEIRYSPMGNWFELGNSKVDADVSSFTPLASEFAKDKDHIFYKDTSIDNEVDYASFSAKEGIAFDKNHVYIPIDRMAYSIQDTIQSENKLFVLEGADPETYERLADWEWSKDAKNWFYNYKIIDVDYKSFTPINANFCKDDKHVYTRTFFDITPCNIDANSFKMINDRYVADSNFIYDFVAWHDGEIKKKLQKFSYTDFNSIEGNDKDYLYFDNQVVYDGILIEDANRAHFKVLDSPTNAYAKNDQYVYYSGVKISEADVETFKLYEYDQYARDKNAVYHWGIKMDGVDLETFGPTEKGSWVYRDKNHTYAGAKIMDNE